MAVNSFISQCKCWSVIVQLLLILKFQLHQNTLKPWFHVLRLQRQPANEEIGRPAQANFSFVKLFLN